MNGAIYWTLREFAVKPFWYGGGGPTVDLPRDSFHHKGLIHYDGAAKPAFAVTSAEFAGTPLFVSPPALPTPLWISIAAVVLCLLAVGLLAAFDLWLFAGIRRAARRRRPPSGRQRTEQQSPERSYA
jgi:beta-glucuronidase